MSHVLPVVKTNAYGHGVEGTVRALKTLQPWGMAVAHASEAITLRRFFRGRILALSAWERTDLRRAIRAGVELVVWDRPSAALVGRAARRLGTRASVHVKIDTGTGRLGTSFSAVEAFLQLVQKNRNLKLRGVFTHFADAEDETDGYTALQLKRFLQATNRLPKTVERHAACTAAALRTPASQLGYVRLGIGLYGIWPSARTKRMARNIHLTPALSWRTRVQQLKIVPSGSYVGYGRTFRTHRKSNLAVLPIGYGDGYPRSLSNTGIVQIRGTRCPVVGRVSMNLTVVDATGVRGVTEGDPVELIGGQGRGVVTADELAERAGTIHYELLARIAEHIPRTVTE